MRITYRQLQIYTRNLSRQQLDCDVTVEINGEAFAADFRIVGEANETGLETNHPVIYVTNADEPRADDTQVLSHIKDIDAANGLGNVGD